MAEVELAQDTLIVHVEGIDRLFALRSRLEAPSLTWKAPKRIPRRRAGSGTASWKGECGCQGLSRRAFTSKRASGYSGTCTTRRKRW
jgi:hypothetical protein